jgi:shikimate kinase
MKIFLVGYMGSGKSATGRILAEKLGMDFIDFDRYIEKGTGKTVATIFETEGEEKFRLLEQEYLKIVAAKENTVIALGGGTPCFHNNMELINRSGASVYIETPAHILAKRLIRSKTSRPLIRGKNEEELKLFIEANLENRNPFYRQADHTVPVVSQTIEEVAGLIQKLFS